MASSYYIYQLLRAPRWLVGLIVCEQYGKLYRYLRKRFATDGFVRPSYRASRLVPSPSCLFCLHFRLGKLNELTSSFCRPYAAFGFANCRVVAGLCAMRLPANRGGLLTSIFVFNHANAFGVCFSD